MDIAALLTSVAFKVGAPMVVSMLKDRFGDTGGKMAGSVIDAVAKQAGVMPAGLPDLHGREPQTVEAAVRSVEAMAPEMIALYQAGLEGQFALAETEAREGGAAAAWRWGWMYLLGVFWLWTIILVPTVNAITGAAVATIELGVLMQLTAWFIALYMGGHTAKELGKNVVDVMRDRKAGA